MYRKEKESGAKRFKMSNKFLKWFEEEQMDKIPDEPQIVTTPTSSKVREVQAMGRISRASLEESTQRALTAHQDVKIPDGPIVIGKDLLQDIRDTLDNEASDGNAYCKELRDKLDNLYPFLNQ